MAKNLKSIPDKKIINLIKQIQFSLGVIVNDNNIHIIKENDAYYNYSINNKISGYISLTRGTKQHYKINARDEKNKEKMYSGLKKIVYWYLDNNLELVLKEILIKEQITKKNNGQNERHFFTMKTELELDGSFKRISIMQDNDVDNTVINQVREKDFLSLEQENAMSLMYYYQFKCKDDFNTVFNHSEIESIMNMLSLSDIKERIAILQAIMY